MKRITSVLLTIITMVAISGGCFAKQKYRYVTPKSPVISDSLKPSIVKYRQGNYTGAMLDLEELVKKEKNNMSAKYYLALCYSKLGYNEEAKSTYAEVAEKGSNETLVYYSKKALACIENPESVECNPSLASKTPETTETGDEDDITKFIRSGKRIHPAAMDTIMKERMEVRLQQEEYKNRNADQLGPLSYGNPTNEEIAAAINTLSKIGINPFSQGNMLSKAGLEYNYNNYSNMPFNYGSTDSDIEQMILYSQLSQQKNNFINYGI